MPVYELTNGQPQPVATRSVAELNIGQSADL
jgi:hypothetical protein